MDHFFLGLICGVIVGLAAAVLASRLAGSVRWVAGIFGRDPLIKKLREAEKKFHDARKEAEKLKQRLEEKDGLIEKAMASLAKKGSLPGAEEENGDS